MLEMNKVMLIGNLTRDPELSYLTNGTALAKLGLAVNRRFKKSTGEYQDETAFVDLTAWRQTAEFCSKYLKKGTRVYVEGYLNFRTWEAQDGSKRSKLDVTVDRIQFVLSKAQQEALPTGGGGAYENAPAPAGTYGNQPAPDGATPQQAPPAQPPAAPAAPQPGDHTPPPAPTEAPADNTADDLPF